MADPTEFFNGFLNAWRQQMGPQLPLPLPASDPMPNSGPLPPSRSGLQVSTTSQLPLPPPASGLMPNSGPLPPSRSGLQIYAPRTEAGPSNALGHRANQGELNSRGRVSGNSGYNVPREAEGSFNVWQLGRPRMCCSIQVFNYVRSSARLLTK